MLAEIDQLADRLDRETQLARVFDERKTVVLAPRIATLVAFRAFRVREKPHLVVADDRHLGGLRCLRGEACADDRRPSRRYVFDAEFEGGSYLSPSPNARNG